MGQFFFCRDMFLFSVRDSVTSLLEEFERRGTLVQQLLGVADGSSSERSKHIAELKSVQREKDSLATEVRKLKESLLKERSLRKASSIPTFRLTRTPVSPVG